MKQNQFTIGIDLGGTKVAFGLVDKKGKIVQYRKEATIHSPHALIDLVSDVVVEFCQKGPVKGIGFVSAGPLNVQKGKLIYPSNFPNWKVVPIVEILRKKLARHRIRKPIYFQNDAMAAALGEGWIGAAKNLKTFLVVTLGTGVGTGVIFEGRCLQYAGMGSEWGLQLINYNSLQKDTKNNLYLSTLEGFASGTGIVRRAKTMGFTGEHLEELIQEIKAGKSSYRQLFHDAAFALAMFCYNMSLGLHPEAILFTGGLMNVQELFFDEIQVIYKTLMEKHPQFETKLKKAKLGNTAGVIGGARLPHMKHHT